LQTKDYNTAAKGEKLHWTLAIVISINKQQME